MSETAVLPMPRIADGFDILFASNGIRMPDRIIDPCSLDPVARRDEPHPFPNQRSGNHKGVYLWFVERGIYRAALPLYVGKSINFGIRLHQHWNFPGKSHGFKGRLVYEHGKFLNDVTRRYVLMTGNMIQVALWYIDHELERRSFEYDLIRKLSPRYNSNSYL